MRRRSYGFEFDRHFSFGCRYLNIVGGETVQVKISGYDSQPDQGPPTHRKDFSIECPDNQVLAGVSAE